MSTATRAAAKSFDWLKDPKNTQDWRVVKLLNAVPDWQKRRDAVDWAGSFMLSADGLVARLNPDGAELSHTDLVIATVDLIGNAYALALTDSTKGHSAALAGQKPNMPTKVDTAMRNKVSIGGTGDAVKYLGPAQAATALAVDLACALGVIPEAQWLRVKIITGIFVHWEADNENQQNAIFVNQFEGTFIALLRALRIIDRDEAGGHPYAANIDYTALVA